MQKGIMDHILILARYAVAATAHHLDHTTHHRQVTHT